MKKVTKWEDVSFVISSSYREKVLNGLNVPKIPSKLSKEIGINKAHVSRALSELLNKKMIKCLTPEIKKGKIFLITDYGKTIIKKSSEM
ncbi:MAG: transcriptional regulator [Candidatus Zambryskibacteria bacterium CG10_big_fil_rev_8_21_14_0_10_34_34]|uniref:Transcriptional regulator n=1 Tax=Candidatus Zambryskibacteria bacterium CG10_big_fil_rev_8_21_14_0_10_34_34 TaxID=1975114 RepID=A0A2H0R087_9BACT|nr:MAG: transcriptional regulator [Candidatus Zambryskibacteria bacterium CG10_big_fil_rev_8_21_14_0_10_34_34]